VSHSVVRQLVLKDIRTAVPLVVGSCAAGVLSLAVLPWSRVAFFVGGSVFIVVLVLLNVLLVSASVIGDRKEKTRLFFLSMPVSTMQYNVSKLVSSLILYVVPSALLTLAALALLRATPLPDGFIPVVIAAAVHCLLYFCVFLAVGLNTESQGWTTTVIVGGNVSVSFLLPFVLNLPSVLPNLGTETAAWGADLVGFMVIELVLSAAALAMSFVVNSRKTEFV
jgi:hypothetical protein